MNFENMGGMGLLSMLSNMSGGGGGALGMGGGGGMGRGQPHANQPPPPPGTFGPQGADPMANPVSWDTTSKLGRGNRAHPMQRGKRAAGQGLMSFGNQMMGESGGNMGAFQSFLPQLMQMRAYNNR